MRPFLTSILTLICLLTTASATLNTYVRISGLTGDSQAEGYEGWVNLLGVRHGGSATVAFSGTPTSSNFQAQAITLTTATSSILTHAADAVASGLPKTVEVDIVRNGHNGANVITRHVFNDAFFSSATIDSTTGNSLPGLTKISFHYSSMSWSVLTFSPTTGEPLEQLTVSHDALANTASLTVTDISSGSGNTDTDSDDMPNSWEIAYGLNPNSNSDRNTDLDGDGFSNYLEYLAGTIPNDLTDFIKVTQMIAPNGVPSASIEWRSVPGKVYNIQRANNALSTSSWTTIKTVTASSGTVTSTTLPAVSGNNIFYRVSVQN